MTQNSVGRLGVAFENKQNRNRIAITEVKLNPKYYTIRRIHHSKTIKITQ